MVGSPETNLELEPTVEEFPADKEHPAEVLLHALGLPNLIRVRASLNAAESIETATIIPEWGITLKQLATVISFMRANWSVPLFSDVVDGEDLIRYWLNFDSTSQIEVIFNNEKLSQAITHLETIRQENLRRDTKTAT